MELIEIVVIIACISIVGGVLGRFIYKKFKHMPTGECACCSHTKQGSKLVKMYYKKHPKS